MKSIDEFATDYAQDKYLPVQTSQAVMAGANYVLDAIQSCIDRHEDGCLALEAIILTIDELKEN